MEFCCICTAIFMVGAIGALCAKSLQVNTKMEFYLVHNAIFKMGGTRTLFVIFLGIYSKMSFCYIRSEIFIISGTEAYFVTFLDIYPKMPFCCICSVIFMVGGTNIITLFATLKAHITKNYILFASIVQFSWHPVMLENFLQLFHMHTQKWNFVNPLWNFYHKWFISTFVAILDLFMKMVFCCIRSVIFRVNDTEALFLTFRT